MSAFVSIYFIFIMGLISPGPDFTIVLRNSLTRSRKQGLLSAVGIVLGLAIHMAYSLFGLGVLLIRAPRVFTFIQICGALYLAYLGVMSFRNSKPAGPQKNAIQEKTKYSSGLWEGFLTNVLNPKAMIFLISLFAQLIQSGLHPKFQYALAALVLLSSLLWFSSLALVLSHSGIQRIMQAIKPTLDKAMGLLLIGFSLKILFELF